MMRTVIDCTTGVITEIPVDDAWILANRPNQVILSIPQNSYALNASATLSAQLKTHPLTNGSQQNLSENLAIQLQVGDAVVNVNLVNGAWSDTIDFVAIGTWRLACLSHVGNELTVEVS